MRTAGASGRLLLGLACCYCLLALPSPVSCQKDPVISSISQETAREVGQTVEFNCTAQHISEYPVYWVKLDKNKSFTILTVDAHKSNPDKRYSVRFDNGTSTFTLQIKELKQSDTGTYQCKIDLSDTKSISATVDLQMRRPPTIFSNTTTHVNVTEGQSFELYCDADGYPVPRITWKRADGYPLVTGENVYKQKVLNVSKSHRLDRGLYICTAENDVGNPAYANASVHIQFAPQISATKPRVGQAQRYDITLECRIEAYPPPVVSWYRKGKELKKDHFEGVSDEFVSSFTLLGVELEEYGEYTCQAQNKHGVAQTRLELFENIVPVCSNSCG